MKTLFFLMILAAQPSYSTESQYPCLKYRVEEQVMFGPETPKGIGAIKKENDFLPGTSFRALSNAGSRPLVVNILGTYYKLVNKKVFKGRLLNYPDKLVWKDEGVVEWTEETHDVIHSFLNVSHFYKNPKVPDIHQIGSNEKPPKLPDDFSFSFPVYFDGKLTELKAIIQYRPLQISCSGKLKSSSAKATKSGQ